MPDYGDSLSAIDVIAGVMVIIFLLEITRRSRLVMSTIAMVSIAYIVFGQHYRYLSPGDFPDRSHRLSGIRIRRDILYTDKHLCNLYRAVRHVRHINGIYRTGDVIMDIGKAIAGRFRGGPAKVATISSALFGSISDLQPQMYTQQGRSPSL